MKFSIIAAVGVTLWATSASGQQSPNASAKTLLVQFTTASEPLRKGEVFSDLGNVLQQRWGGVPPARLDSIADGLVAIALRLQPKTVEESLRLGDAIGIIARGADKRARIPYAGAFTRLKRVFENAADVGGRGAALGAIARLGDEEQALVYLAEVARGNTGGFSFAASRAIDHLITDLGEKGSKVVRALDQEGSVKHPEAQVLLSMYRANGYKPLRPVR